MFLPYQEVFLWGLVVSLIMSLIYRVFTKPSEIRQLKKDMKFYKDKSKESQKKKDTKKANEYMSEMMKLSQKQMKSTMKPMFISMAVVLFIIGFINSTYSGVLVEVEHEDGDSVGFGTFAHGDFSHQIKLEKAGEDITVMIDTNGNGDFSDETKYSPGDLAYIGDTHWSVVPAEDMASTRMDLAVKLPFTMPFFGWTSLNWLFWYILATLPATWLFRKFLGVE